MIPLPYRLLAGALLIAGAFGAGWLGHVKYRAGVDARDALALSETNRESERLAARNMQRVSDALTKDRLASDRLAADASERLRKLAASTAAAPGCPERNDDTRPAAGLLHDDALRDIVSLASEADATADRLRACQAVIAQDTNRSDQ